MTITTKTERLINLEEYQKMVDLGILGPSDKVELIFGKILHMSPIGSRHIAAVNRITRLFSKLLDASLMLQVQNPIAITPNSQPEPDIALLSYREDFYDTEIPPAKEVQLLIEVSNSTLEFDRTDKLRLYAGANIPEYWIVNLRAQQIECHRSPQQDIYLTSNTYKHGDTITCLAQPTLQIPVQDILL